MYQDKNLTCRDCGDDFVFSSTEQQFFADKGFTNDPSRCPQCRSARKQQNNRGGSFKRNSGSQQREMFAATCAACGEDTQVPFRPSGDRPVYCRSCFTNK